MPCVDDVLDSLEDACYFTTLDLASGYWQIPMASEDMEKPAFCTRKGNFEFWEMPMGLVNASYTFQQMMQLVLSGLQWQNNADMLSRMRNPKSMSRISQGRALPNGMCH